MQENPLLTIRAAQHIGQGLELKILMITNDATVAVHGSCCIVTVLQVKKPDPTVSALSGVNEKSEKFPMSEVLIIGLFQYVFGC
jgi:hypothetical protein